MRDLRWMEREMLELKLQQRNQQLAERNQLIQKAKGAIEQLQMELETERQRRKEAEASCEGAEHSAAQLEELLEISNAERLKLEGIVEAHAAVEGQFEQRSAMVAELQRELSASRDAEQRVRSEAIMRQRRSAESEEQLRAELSSMERENGTLRLRVQKAETELAHEEDARRVSERNAALKQQQLEILQRTLSAVEMRQSELQHGLEEELERSSKVLAEAVAKERQSAREQLAARLLESAAEIEQLRAHHADDEREWRERLDRCQSMIPTQEQLAAIELRAAREVKEAEQRIHNEYARQEQSANEDRMREREDWKVQHATMLQATACL